MDHYRVCRYSPLYTVAYVLVSTQSPFPRNQSRAKKDANDFKIPRNFKRSWFFDHNLINHNNLIYLSTFPTIPLNKLLIILKCHRNGISPKRSLHISVKFHNLFLFPSSQGWSQSQITPIYIKWKNWQTAPQKDHQWAIPDDRDLGGLVNIFLSDDPHGGSPPTHFNTAVVV